MFFNLFFSSITIFFFALPIYVHCFLLCTLCDFDHFDNFVKLLSNLLYRWNLWPSRDFPPVAIGPHYLMSADCVHYLTKNKHRLRGVGTLEDVSISVWLRGYGVVPEHVKWFSNYKNFGCVDGERT